MCVVAGDLLHPAKTEEGDVAGGPWALWAGRDSRVLGRSRAETQPTRLHRWEPTVWRPSASASRY